jgi:Flp pilus assembly protein TadD
LPLLHITTSTKEQKLQKIDELYNNAANAYEAGDMDGAKSWANKCLKIDQKEFRSLNLLGVILANEGKNEAAANAYQKSLEANPRNPQTINNLANILSKEGELQKAANLYKNAIIMDPYFTTARQNFAKTSLKLGNYDEAISESAKCFELDSTNGEPLITLGNALKNKKEFIAAEEAYKIALNYPKNKKDALIELGILKSEQKLSDEALGYFVEVLQIDPNHSGSYCNISSILIDKGELVKAKGAVIKAFELDQNDAVNHINLGVLLKWEGKYEEAKEAFLKAIELGDPKNAAKTNLGLLLMLSGDYEQGLAFYEYRPKTGILCNAPKYEGEDLGGKTLLVYHEQGFGDTINFARLLKHEKLKNASIIFSPQEPLQALFAASSLGVTVMSQAQIVEQNSHFDYHTSLINLLLSLHIRANNIPENVKYICDDKEKVKFFADKLPNGKQKIGIVWSGNKQYTGDILRSINATSFVALKNIPATFVSLQKEFQQEDMELLQKELGLIDLSELLVDFTDTSALIESLDLVITVDTSVAHLSAAKGKPTWILIPSVPDWRWGMSGDCTPWYDSVRLFRQTTGGNWEEVFERIKTNLQ